MKWMDRVVVALAIIGFIANVMGIYMFIAAAMA